VAQATVVAVVVLAALGLSYAFAGDSFLLFLTYAALALVGVGVLFILAILADAARGEKVDWGRFRNLLGWVVSLLAALGACLFVQMEFAWAAVHIDNHSGKQDVRVLPGDGELARVRAGRRVVAYLRKGTYQLVVEADGEPEDLVTAEVEDTGPYVLNVHGAHVYARGSVEYSDLPLLARDMPETREDRKWFKADVDYLFQGPPESITVKRTFFGSTTKTYLRRGEPKRGKR
jgi:hypothetical protein